MPPEDLVSRDRLDDERSYIFKHVVTQEVAYESIPFALRATLHVSAGGVIEAGEPEAVERNLDLLAHHFWHGDDELRKREYLLRAGDAAQAAYANTAAIDYFERLAPLVEETERIDVLLKLGRVLELVGDWGRARTVDGDALRLAVAAGENSALGWSEAALAEVARKQGAFEEAVERLERARSLFEQAGTASGVGQVLHVDGTIAAQRGDAAVARERYEASLAIRKELDDRRAMASLLSNLGILAEWEGDYEQGLALHREAIALNRERGDRWRIAACMTNMGMNAMYRKQYAEALTSFAEAMRLNREVGDVWMVALSHHNLGNAARELEDLAAARTDYAAGLRIYADYSDAWALAQLIEDVAIYAARTGMKRRAAELVGAADRLRDECGSPRNDTLEEELSALVATDGLGALRTSGRRLDLQASAELALDALVV